MPKRTTVALLLSGGIFLWGCSKTQDTAPATRLFGSPPVIQSVDLAQMANGGVAVCDYTAEMNALLCQNGVPFGSLITPLTPLLVTVNYTTGTFTTHVTDPDNTTNATDILLVTGSFLTTDASTGRPSEVSLVMLDDGGTLPFNFKQTGVNFEDCSGADPCACSQAVYKMNSNDSKQNDGIFMRGFAMLSPKIVITDPPGIALSDSGLIQNCIVRDSHQYPAITNRQVGQPISFKIEAVDKEGNLATWPIKPSMSFGPTTVTCKGGGPGGATDLCACCILLGSAVECQNLPGLVGTTMPDGFCVDAFK